MTTSQIASSILAGEVDKELMAIADALRFRQSRVADEKRLSFNRGDIARFNSNVRPKYLNGFEVTVERVLTKRLAVRINNVEKTPPRFRGRIIRVPVHMIDHLDKDTPAVLEPIV